jgi:hypothetical protein
MRCKARTKAGNKCDAPVVERGLCFFHAHPEKLAELGRQGGKKNRHGQLGASDISHRPLRSVSDVRALLEETINQVRQGKLDLRSANALGFLAGILLKALEKGRIEDRLAHLEAIMGHNPGASSDAFEFRRIEEKTHEQP